MINEISALSNVIELLRRQLNKDLPSQHIALLLAVAKKPGITMPELCTVLDMPQGTVSRNVKLMSHNCANPGTEVTKNGYGLLKTDQAVANRYRLAVFLTKEGEKLVQKLVRMMGHKILIEDFQAPAPENAYPLREQALS